MLVTYTGKKQTFSDRTKETVSKKLNKLNKYFGSETEAKIKVEPFKNDLDVEVTVRYRGKYFRAEEKGHELINLVEHVVSKLEKQIRHQKSKLKNRLHDGVFNGDAIEDAPEDGAENKVVKSKRFIIKPIDIDEAIMEMELLSHNFYVFVNSDSGQVNVLYRRYDGQYGILEPEY